MCEVDLGWSTFLVSGGWGSRGSPRGCLGMFGIFEGKFHSAVRLGGFGTPGLRAVLILGPAAEKICLNSLIIVEGAGEVHNNIA